MSTQTPQIPGWDPPTPPSPKRQHLVAKIAVGVAAGIALFIVGIIVLVAVAVSSSSPNTQAADTTVATPASTTASPATMPVATKPKPAPAATFSEGTYKVGTDIKPGLYKATVTSGMGYWARLADPDGNNILANDVKTSGTMYLRVRSSDRYIEISGTTFHKVG